MELGMEEWFKYRQEELETLTKEDKKHLYDMEAYANIVWSCADGKIYIFSEEQLDKLEKEILDSMEYFNKKYYMAGFTDAINMILKK